MAHLSSESDQENNGLLTFLFITACGVFGGFSDLLSSFIPASIHTTQMTEFLIHFGQAVLFGAAGFIGKISMESVMKRFSKKDKQ